MSFELAAALWSFGWMPSDKLPEVAIEALESGMDSPSLLELASADCSADPAMHRLFERTLAELRQKRLSKVEAGKFIADDIAQKISTGQISPIEGARAIWRVSLECDELAGKLAIFGGRVTDYEGLPELRDRISESIVSEAKRLLEGPT